MNSRLPVSVVIPVYNEEANIASVVQECLAQVVLPLGGSELIVVDDGSTDSTANILKALSKDQPALKVIHLSRRSGNGHAVRCGFEQAGNELVCQVDGDGQFNFRDFWKLYSRIPQADLVLGVRVARQDPLYRRLVANIARVANRVLFGFSFQDINSSFKIVRVDVLKGVLSVVGQNPFAISVLLAAGAKWRGHTVEEVPVEHFPRKGGTSKFANPAYLFKGCLMCFWDILCLKAKIRPR